MLRLFVLSLFAGISFATTVLGNVIITEIERKIVIGAFADDGLGTPSTTSEYYQ